jgi:hypothetical protein
VTAWCAISSHAITGPYFSEIVEGHTVTVNAEWYEVMLEPLLRNKLHLHQPDLLCFQQDRANCSNNINFHANPHDNVSRQTHFSFWGHHLAHPHLILQ